MCIYIYIYIEFKGNFDTAIQNGVMRDILYHTLAMPLLGVQCKIPQIKW